MYRKKIIVIGAGILTLNTILILVLLVLPVRHRDPQSQVSSTLPTSTPVAQADISGTSTREEIVRGYESRRMSERVRVPVVREGTVLEAMRAHVAKDPSFTFSGKEFPGLGFFVEEVGGLRAPEGKAWILYVNGVTANVGVSQEFVREGDTVEWRLEKHY